MRDYELMFLLDPRLTDDEASALTQEYQEMLQAAGAEVRPVEGWGRRKMAYSINKLSEATYVLFEVGIEEGANPFPELEQRMQQNEKVLRYLTVRTDAGRLRRRARDEEPEAETEAGQEQRKESD